jgi:ADP-ribose pyrophosphatase YjhB (NUDIX family)
MAENLLFQYCQKLVVISQDKKSVLLARRKGEADYNGTYSFIGGKMETTDASLTAGMQREKNEEIGAGVRLRIIPSQSYNVLFRKRDGNSMVLPHIAAQYIGGTIQLSEEYSDYAWVPISQLAGFEPKIENIPQAVHWALGMLDAADEADFCEI